MCVILLQSNDISQGCDISDPEMRYSFDGSVYNVSVICVFIFDWLVCIKESVTVTVPLVAADFTA